ncbi:hypothetical protein FS827_10415 [Agrobacterium vitis]|uniref:hypothetical protein n=1 Tax=Allorhizobium ampelinum TaxID=3025782 RepID=UPI001F37F34A|nr:hypothetical protein [Allorhizobium ampelinum]MCF1461739.1 hypothetical protein [Allorhizobium ampelinum]
MADTKAQSKVTNSTSADNADTYALFREEHNENHGAGWWVDLRRRGIRVVRLFKDSIYGSPQASFDQAKAYRDAAISVLPPATNHEQAVLLRKNNKSGISGVRHVELAEDQAWEASLLTQNTSARSSPYANMVRSKRKPWQSHCAENDWRNCRSNTWLMQNTQRR